MIRNTAIVILSILFFACAAENNKSENTTTESQPVQTTEAIDTAYFAGGCFWCVEASFDQIKGVKEAVSGYSGGEEKNPSYKEVSYGRTNHAEAVMVLYDSSVLNYETLLDIFFVAHDPTQLNRQGPDVGKQYRSAIFYRNSTEKNLALKKMNELASKFDDEIVTELTAFTKFWEAEDYHQDYEKKNPNDRYIVNVSKPKIDKVAKEFKDLLK
ncbi:peptide-methionine (S)-S-oxide reductase MsrA [Marivirga salinae]|uniref:Peptide methionine sulfoxide reductase MsrA n=1 Tax=Marivirga salinarum TaxID=3059078 RepID=A0AA51NA87_9BACT|nr:peptide-methionine (S)-S-oxide reductase MsrA [Marivirga sp. BDSF4-3]WMN11319.1 peptide-methionine (S)-S-oxide reductase MsrA [Marivirga sp. BDSF4-3]